MPTVHHESKDALHATLTVDVSKSDYIESVNKKLKEYRQKAQIKGFRPGKVPMALIKRKFGNALLIDEVNELVGKEINNYINDNKIKTIGQPIANNELKVDINIQNPSDYSFQFDMGIAPDFNLEGINPDNKLPFYNISVNDEAIDKEVEAVRGKFGAGFEEDINDINDTDLLIVDLSEMENGSVKEEGFTKEGTYISMRDIANEELKDKLLTATLGDTFNTNVYNIENKSRDHVRKHILGLTPNQVINEEFQMTIKEIKRVKKAELNEELFAKIFPGQDITTIDAFREKIQDEIKRNYHQSSNHHFQELVFEELITKNELELPEDFLKIWLEASNKDLAADFFETDDYTNFKKSLRWNLIREKIAEEYKVEVGMDDIKNNIKGEILRYFNYQIPMEGEMMDNMVNRVLSDKEEVRRRFDLIMDEKVLQSAAEHVGKEMKEITLEKFEEITTAHRNK